ncbi:unnamed protein product [Fusarium langsethiae]|nr:unnamed protein product [Fusarium langsethiae]
MYLGESSGFNLLLGGYQGPVTHFPLPGDTCVLHEPVPRDLQHMDNLEIQILNQRGAFTLPPRPICDDIIDSYFTWVHPIVPVINRTHFMSQYEDAKNPPSLLLLQCVLLAGARISTNPELMKDGSTSTAVATFYRRAKALYDAGYERDRITLVQSMLLMGWYWAGPADVTKNMFYWSQAAIAVAQNFGLHRNIQNSNLSITEKRLRKRIWWTLFTRDRALAIALGQSVSIDLDDCDVEMLTEDDFIEHDRKEDGPEHPGTVQVQFFLQYLKLSKLIGLIVNKYSKLTGTCQEQNDTIPVGLALSRWMQECPMSLRWEQSRYHFWSAVLHLHYFAARCLFHRASSTLNRKTLQDTRQTYGSRDGAVRAASMINLIVETLSSKNQLCRCPPFVVHALFSAVVIHLHVSNTPSASISRLARRRLGTSLQAIKELAQVWTVGRTVLTMIETVSRFSRYGTDHNSSANDVMIDLGCADDQNESPVPLDSNLTTEHIDDLSESVESASDHNVPNHKLDTKEGHSTGNDICLEPFDDITCISSYSLENIVAQPDFNSLSLDWGVIYDSDFEGFYPEEIDQVYGNNEYLATPTLDQWESSCQQDYSFAVPWSLFPDMQFSTTESPETALYNLGFNGSTI